MAETGKFSVFTNMLSGPLVGALTEAESGQFVAFLGFMNNGGYAVDLTTSEHNELSSFDCFVDLTNMGETFQRLYAAIVLIDFNTLRLYFGQVVTAGGSSTTGLTWSEGNILSATSADNYIDLTLDTTLTGLSDPGTISYDSTVGGIYVEGFKVNSFTDIVIELTYPFLTDDDGDYLVDDNGDYLIGG